MTFDEYCFIVNSNVGHYLVAGNRNSVARQNMYMWSVAIFGHDQHMDLYDFQIRSWWLRFLFLTFYSRNKVVLFHGIVFDSY